MLVSKMSGMYIHIPFCIKKCNYCDFLSFKCTESKVEEYMDALIKEIKMQSNFYINNIIRTIYIGGGTPSIIDSKYIIRIMNTIYDNYSVLENAEITLEMNPATIDKEKLIAYKKAGINRLSIGLQSADNEQLHLLGRVYTFEEFCQNYKLARECGFENINIDIMSAIPEQTYQSYVDTINKVLVLNPEHISSYSLIIEEGTPFYEMQDKLELPDEDTEREMYYITAEMLQQKGYNRYEISNYSKKGYESKHNLSYWQNIPYTGLGLGAASYTDNKRYSNPVDIEQYVKKINQLYTEFKNTTMSKEEYLTKMDIEAETLTEQDRIEEFMFLGLRCTEGIKKSDFKQNFNKDLDEIYHGVINKLKQQKLLEEKQDTIKLTKKGIDLSNHVLAKFLL